jgi:hypothetical protein
MGLHEIELRPDVDSAEFERFYAEELASVPMMPGWHVRLLKADRGARAGKYAVLIEMESEEARNRYFPVDGEASDELGRFLKEHPDFDAAWQKADSFEVGAEVTTDYLVVSE